MTTASSYSAVHLGRRTSMAALRCSLVSFFVNCPKDNRARTKMAVWENSFAPIKCTKTTADCTKVYHFVTIIWRKKFSNQMSLKLFNRTTVRPHCKQTCKHR